MNISTKTHATQRVLGLIVLLNLALVSPVLSQVEIDRYLIGTAGLEFENNNFSLSSSIGEALIATEQVNDFVITQGFQQSNFVLNNPLIVELDITPAACIGANNGAISVVFTSPEISLPLQYIWSTGDTSSTINQLEVGTYSITVTGANGTGVTNTVRLGAIDSVDCRPIFYTSITPNGDGFNDYWHIDNAEFFLRKEVEIFNRYGTRVWRTDDYINLIGSFEGKHQNGNDLPDGTYFFVADFEGNNYKGWIEIIR